MRQLPFAMAVVLGVAIGVPCTVFASRSEDTTMTGKANGLCAESAGEGAAPRVLVDRGSVVHLTGCEEIQDSVTGCIFKLVEFRTARGATRACFAARMRDDYIVVSRPDLCVGPQDTAVSPSTSLCPAGVILEVLKAFEARGLGWLGHVIITLPDHP